MAYEHRSDSQQMDDRNDPKCKHPYVEGAGVDGRRALRCMHCKAVVHVIPEQGARDA